MKKEDIQNFVDKTPYPQNYYFDIETLEPRDLLIPRLKAFKKATPELFKKHKSFLDIGSSLGYFLFYQEKIGTKRILGIEPDQKTQAISFLITQYRKLLNVELFGSIFSTYVKKEIFEFVFVGNAFHYLYRDEGWKVLKKIADICEKELVMELPLEGKHLVEIGGFEDNGQSRDFTKERFLEEANKYFCKIEIFESGTIGERSIVKCTKNL